MFTPEERRQLFMELHSKSEDDIQKYLCSLIHKRRINRRIKAGVEIKKNKEVAFDYKVRIGNKQVVVCKLAFCGFHGLSQLKLRRVQDILRSELMASPKKALQYPMKKILPGPLSSKTEPLKYNKEQLLKLEKHLKDQIVAGKAPLPVVVLTKINLKSFCPLLGGELEKNSLSIKGGKPTLDHSQDADKSDKGKLEFQTLGVKLLKEAFSSTCNELPDAPVVEQPEAPTVEPTPTVEPIQKKLKDFPLVVKSIDHTPEELLLDMHFLLFLDGAEVSKLKGNILDFEGFAFESDTEEYDERKDFLGRMSGKIVNDVAKAFSLEVCAEKEATISNVLSFLLKPDPQMLKDILVPNLSDLDLDMEGMSDSDDSITCEVVHKKVECIDLISSGDESDGKALSPKKVAAVVEPVEPMPAETKDRTLRDFETICKIVNTHPHEYLVDIYDLLYMSKHEPRTLRKDILDFGGFSFLKGSLEYVKRKQLLDKMLYNSVRRIYNTLIHNSTEVKVFSKPTMIGEIFDFLLKLPDHDTSIRPTARPGIRAPVYRPPIKNVAMVTPPLGVPSLASSKLSDLKRVFQRVACFPCEYLIDVHKLLFMSDCDPAVIRQNIFGFKGFSFGADSPEFQQRKMYLEYLTFHSLRKISSVLTTRSVDLRNSTKHELATHLTKVLAEYCNTTFETEPPQPPLNVPEPSNVEQIVVTPLIEPLNAAPTVVQVSESSTSSSATQMLKEMVNSIGKQVPETTSTDSFNIAIVSTSSLPPGDDPPVESLPPPPEPPKKKPSPPKKTPPARRKRKIFAEKAAAKAQATAEQSAAMQFPDIHLPEIEKYRQIYGPNLNMCPPTFPPMPFPVMQRFPVPVSAVQPSMVNRRLMPRPPNILVTNMLPTIQAGSVCSVEPEKVMDPCPKKPKTSSPVETDNSKSDALHNKIRDAMNEDEEDCDKPLSAFLGHPNDRILKQQICDIVEQTNLSDITINEVVQKIYNLYPKFDLNYRKEFIKSTLRSLLYRLGDEDKPAKAIQNGSLVDSPEHA